MFINFKKGSIRNQLIGWFLVISIGPIVLLSWFNYYQSTNSLRVAAENELSQSALIKAKFITNWFEYRFMDISIQSSSKKNIKFLKNLSNKWPSELPLNEYVKSDDWILQSSQFEDELVNLSHQYDYIYDIFLIDQQANVLFSILKEDDLGTNLNTGEFSKTTFAENVRKTLKTGKIYFSELERFSPSNNRLAGFVTAPLVDELGQKIGALAFQLKLDRIFSFVASRSERDVNYYIVNTEGVLQTPIDEHWDTALKQEIELSDLQDKISALAKSQKQFSESKISSAHEYLNPLGKRVIGVEYFMSIGDTNWVLVSEIESEKALITATKAAAFSFAVLIVSILVVLVAAIYLSSRFSQPIVSLAKNAVNIAMGKTHQLIAIENNKELSQLTNSFSFMLEKQRSDKAKLEESQQKINKSLKELELQKYAYDQHAIIATTDVKGTILSANQKFSEISGYTFEELIGKNHRILNSGYHDVNFFKEMYREISHGKVWKSEICNKNKQGELYWVDTTIIPFLNSKGKPETYIAIRADITDRKNAQRGLARSEAMARSIFNSVADGIITISNEGKIMSSNPAANDIFGYHETELVNKSVTDLIPKKLRKKHLSGFEKVQNGGKHSFLNSTEQVKGLTKDGKIFPLELAVTQVVVGDFSYFAAMVRDITQRQNDEHEKQVLLKSTDIKLQIANVLSDSTELSKRIADALDLLIELDILPSIKDAAMFLLDKDEKESNQLNSINHKFSLLEQDRSFHEDVLKTREILIVNQTEDSTYSCYIPIANHGKTLNQLLGVLTLHASTEIESNIDILTILQEVSDQFASAIVQEHAQQMLKEASKLEKQSNQLKSEFLASMSHEIRTPMNGILGMLGLLLNSNLSSDQENKANIAKSSAESLLVLINDILDFSKIEAGKLDLEILNFDLLRVLSDFVESIALKAQTQGIEIILDTTGIKDASVKGDPGRLRQILTNLVGNAIKFTQDGEIIIKASLVNKNKNSLELHCSVIDTGIGIPEGKLKTLFDEFTQVDASTTRKYGGTGLGLSISQKLCSLMGGKIEVTSELGQGSNFSFQIKLEKGETPIQFLPNSNIDSLNILIVDDNKTNQLVLKEQLELWGATVSIAKSCQEAFDTCNSKLANQQKLFDIAFLDMQMPLMSGADLGEQLKLNPNLRDMKLIMMTSISEQNELEYYIDLGFSGYFSKPATPYDLFNALNVLAEQNTQDSYPFVTSNYLNTLVPSESEVMNNQLSFPNSRLLLVEDNQINQQVALGILEQFGLTADIAANGIEAIELLKLSKNEQLYNLVIMDCQMPEMDGYEASQEIRKGAGGSVYLSVPILAMTANAMEGDRQKCIDAGMSDYLSKPIEPETLRNKLQKWLHLSKNKMSKENTEKEPTKSIENDRSITQDDDNLVWDETSVLKRVMDNQTLLQTLIKLFIDGVPQKIMDLKKAADINDIDQVKHLSHTIKGIAANLSGTRLQNQTKKLELAAINKETSLFPSLIVEIEKEFNALFSKLDEYLRVKSNSSKNEPTKQPKISQEKLKTIVTKLLERLQQNDYIDPQDIKSIVTDIENPQLIKNLSLLEKQISQFETNNAIKTIEKIMKDLNMERNHG